MRVPNAKNAINHCGFLMILGVVMERRDREKVKIVNIPLVLKISLKSWPFSAARFGGSRDASLLLKPVPFYRFCLKSLKKRCPQKGEIVDFRQVLIGFFDPGKAPKWRPGGGRRRCK